MIDAALASVRPAAEVNDIRVENLVHPGAGPVWGDPDRLQQVFWNLLTNAIKFTAKGGRIQVVHARVASQVEVTVSDSGRGMNAEFLPHAFDRFRQADGSTTRAHGGLGLGRTRAISSTTSCPTRARPCSRPGRRARRCGSWSRGVPTCCKATSAGALTAFARSEDRQRALRSGFQLHVPKPVDPAELVTIVASLAGRSSGH